MRNASEESDLLLIEAISTDGGTAWILVSPAETDGKLFAVDLDTGQVSLVLADEAGRPVYHANPYDLPGARFRLLDDSTALYLRTGPDSSSLETEFRRRQ
jgi:hypothetical protein